MWSQLNGHSIKYTAMPIRCKPYGNHMAKTTVDSQNIKEEKQSLTTIENHQFTGENSRRGRKERGSYKTTRKQVIRCS